MSDVPPAPDRFWIRNDKGKVWGPMAAQSLALLIPQNAFPGRLQASIDGLTFAMIGRFPSLREVLPQETWGVDPSEIDPKSDVVQAPVSAADVGEALDPTDLAPADAGAALDPTDLAPPAEAPPPPAAAPPPPAASPAAAAPPPAASEGDTGPTVELPVAGDLAETSPIRLAYLAAAAGDTCHLVLHTDAGDATVFYRKGSPEQVESPTADLGQWLVAHGLIDEAKRKQADDAKAGFGGSFAGALFALGLLDAGQAFQHLARFAAEAYVEVLQIASGRFEVDHDRPPPGDAFPLGATPLAHVVAAARAMPEAEVRRRLGERVRAPAMKSNASAVAIEDLRLGPQETRLYPLFDGVHTLEELAVGDGVDAPTLLRLGLLLAEVGFLSFGDAEPTTDPAADAAAAPGEKPPAKEPPAKKPAPEKPAEPAKDWRAEEKRLATLRDRFASADHFVVLGLKKQCSADDVKKAYTEAVRTYHPDRHVGAPESVTAILREIFGRVNEANDAIADDAKRRAYVNELAAAEMQDAAPAAAGEDLIAKVRHLLKLRKGDEAAEILDALIAENPGNAAAWAWRAWAKVVRATDKKAVRQEAVGLIGRALKLDPRCGDAYLVAGRIAKLYGDQTNATKYFAKAKALGAGDES